jgi:hypothetical protein
MGYVRTRARVTGPTPETVELVFNRDGGKCVRCMVHITGHRGFSWSLHHRRGRDGKPDSHEPQNLILVCGASNVHGCHGAIHSRRSEAQDAGWWLSRITGADPLQYAVLVGGGARWVYLTADCRYSDDPAVAS